MTNLVLRKTSSKKQIQSVLIKLIKHFQARVKIIQVTHLAKQYWFFLNLATAKKKNSGIRDGQKQKGINSQFQNENKLKSVVTAQTRQKTGEVEALLFRAKIAPESNSSAEKELTKNISKDMFKGMEVLGQFNLGFIIAKLDNDLFIIDQHASDEKFNQGQQRNTKIKSQRLILFPRSLN